MAGVADAGQWLLVGVLMVSSLLNVAYLMPVVVRGFFFAPDDPRAGGIREAPLFCLIPLCLTAAGCLVLFFFADHVHGLLQRLVGG